MKIRVTSFVLVLALGASLLAGCEEEACDPGFEREAGVCIDVRTRLVGTWTASDTCNRSGSASSTKWCAFSPAPAAGWSSRRRLGNRRRVFRHEIHRPVHRQNRLVRHLLVYLFVMR